jgi:hypothetical protein
MEIVVVDVNCQHFPMKHQGVGIVTNANSRNTRNDILGKMYKQPDVCNDLHKPLKFV